MTRQIKTSLLITLLTIAGSFFTSITESRGEEKIIYVIAVKSRSLNSFAVDQITCISSPNDGLAIVVGPNKPLHPVSIPRTRRFHISIDQQQIVTKTMVGYDPQNLFYPYPFNLSDGRHTISFTMDEGIGVVPTTHYQGSMQLTVSQECAHNH